MPEPSPARLQALLSDGPLRRGRLLARVSPSQRGDLDAVLDRLVDEGLVTARAVVPEPRFISVEYTWVGADTVADR